VRGRSVSTGVVVTVVAATCLLLAVLVATATSFARGGKTDAAQQTSRPLATAILAPRAATKPPGFDARDPADEGYTWTSFDREIRAVTAARLRPIVYVHGAPAWAQSGSRERPNDGAVRPSPSDLADFATALARRFGGSFRGLPRIRHWQVWNEPNLSIELMPQSEGGRPVSPSLYRNLVNAMSRAVHAVHADNVVIAGGLAPFGGNVNDPSGGPVPDQERTRPLEFMREMLCMSRGSRPAPTCNARSDFDVWAHHPYTYGGPTHRAFHPDDVSLGDLPEMRRLLRAAEKAGHIRSRQQVGFWVTEFSYDSQPGDPKGLPPALHARWTAEALYRMWQNGVGLVTWFLLRDQPFPDEMFQSGLYLRGAGGVGTDRPKLALRAFRFPFVAFRLKDRSISYWGRTPTSTRTAVVVEQRRGAAWVRVAAASVSGDGVFQGRIARVRGNGALRARLANGRDVSLGFGLTVPKDFRFCPWGSFC
jgi:hypothetical protein